MSERSRQTVDLVVVAAASLLLLGLARWRAITDPALLGYDETLYLVQGQALADGLIPGRDTWVNKPPLVAVLFAVGPMLFGLQTIPVRVMQLVSLWLAGLVCWRIGRIWGGPVAGITAGLALPLLTSTGLPPAEVLPCFTEPFFVLPLAIAMGATLLAREGGTGRAALLLSALGGASLGMAIQIRQNALLLVPVLGLGAWVANAGRRWSAATAWACGLLASFVPVLLFLFYHDAVAGAWFWSWSLPREIHNFNPNELADRAVPYLWSYVYLFPRLTVLALVGAISAPGALRFVERARRPLRWIESTVLLVFLAACVAMCVAGGRFFLHYLVMLAPVLALFAGLGLQSAWNVLCRPGDRSWRRWGTPVLIAVIGVLGFRELQSVGRAMRQGRDVQPFERLAATRTGELLATVSRLTGPGDRIFVVGTSPGLYYRSGRAPAAPDFSGEVLQASGILSPALWERPVPGLDGSGWRPIMQVLADGLERGRLVLDLTTVPAARRRESEGWTAPQGADWLLSGQWVNWNELEGRSLQDYPLLEAEIRSAYRPLEQPVEGVTVYVRNEESARE